MESFACCYGLALVLFPIPIGLLWVSVYRNRRSLGLPDWFSGILAQGIISGHHISSGDATDGDYGFIIVVTLITTFIVLLSLGFCAAVMLSLLFL